MMRSGLSVVGTIRVVERAVLFVVSSKSIRSILDRDRPDSLVMASLVAIYARSI